MLAQPNLLMSFQDETKYKNSQDEMRLLFPKKSVIEGKACNDME